MHPPIASTVHPAAEYMCKHLAGHVAPTDLMTSSTMARARVAVVAMAAAAPRVGIGLAGRHGLSRCVDGVPKG